MKTYLITAALLVVIAGLTALAWPINPYTPTDTTTQTAQKSAISSETSLQVEESTASGQQTPSPGGHLALTLDIPTQTVAPGAEIVATVRLTNTGTTALTIEYFIGQLFEIIIKNAEGETVYRYSETNPYRYMASRPLQLVLNPGETHQQQIKIKLVDSSEQPLPPGRYTASAYLTAGIEGYAPPEPYEVKAAAKSNTVEIVITS